MKRLVRMTALAAVAAAATLAAAVPAQAAGSAWTVKYEGALGTPSPYDIRTVWSGKCGSPNKNFTFSLLKELSRTEDSATYQVVGSGQAHCEQNETYRAELMHYDYYRDQGFSLAKGTTYDVQFMGSSYFAQDTVTI